ncbi:hypothetical protein AVEN_267912-1 [Araneus ventricosus]|uniref:Uncharacterized protein n=1 Tax=Araneus ventricosus TaxID=182803 RepID=A0A4Y2KAL0_ARAVE|nr:hypothetical protein AVEN_267912-1 [Araneus ventricosus]
MLLTCFLSEVQDLAERNYVISFDQAEVILDDGKPAPERYLLMAYPLDILFYCSLLISSEINYYVKHFNRDLAYKVIQTKPKVFRPLYKEKYLSNFTPILCTCSPEYGDS